jgi:hypothetical protein
MVDGGDEPWKPWFAWYPMWLHFEKPALGLGRLVWLRFVERRMAPDRRPKNHATHLEYRLPRVIPEQRRRDRYLVIILFATGVASASLLFLPGLMLSGAHAADLRCPPKHTACWQVRLAVETFGEPAMVARVKACGWSEARIEEARKCLR